MTEYNYLLTEGENRVALADAIALVNMELFPFPMNEYSYSYMRTVAMQPTDRVLTKIKELSSSNDLRDEFYEKADVWIWQTIQLTGLERSYLIDKVKTEYETVQKPAY
ncbi:hypothetical protein F7734_11450 [Scytonema sp. UIC 10036]|uniref:hypothetical protein n=1 Tax=Scytonema sp. UIC 10036 TaxID=2304196 RepID=UPI0012DA4FBE|nr:hypothetical protein [Scytonema sp. UIC 10036]MUG93019.1 hypothetical protein [Scytonema sp. UIC 10036]